MARKPSPSEPTSQQPQGVVVSDSMNAPIIYFDGAPNYGNRNGIIAITIVASRHLSNGNDVKSDIVAVGHLRCSIRAAIDLRNALDQALLLGAPTREQPN